MKSDIAYKEPAVPIAFTLPTGVTGSRWIVFIPISASSSNLSIALTKLPVVSPFSGSTMSFLFLSFALKVLIFIAIIIALFCKNIDLASFTQTPLFSAANDGIEKENNAIITTRYCNNFFIKKLLINR